jgi:hypothetical protein
MKKNGVEFAAFLSWTTRSWLTPVTVAHDRYRTSASYGHSVLGAAANFPVFCFHGCATKFKFHQHVTAVAHRIFYLSTKISFSQNTTMYSVM